MASSLESMAEKKQSKAENLSSRAREIIGKIKNREKSHHQLVDEEAVEHMPLQDTNSNAYSNSYSDDEAFSPARSKRKLITVVSDPIDSPRSVITDMWRDRDAERMANWQNEDCNPRKRLQQKLLSNGTDRSQNYGSVKHRDDEKSNGTASKQDKWSTAIKQIQKHKDSTRNSSTNRHNSIWKIIGRNRAKRIDQRSRWVFPLTFIVFNISYWGYYLYWKEGPEKS